jgi:hypothetical protein
MQALPKKYFLFAIDTALVLSYITRLIHDGLVHDGGEA